MRYIQLSLILGFLCLISPSIPVVAQTSMTSEAEAPPATEKYQVDFDFFGFINWGYGVSENFDYSGVSENGTADLHTVALQFRLALADRNELVLQLANDSVGTSPSNELRDDIEIDWLFYRRVLSDEFSVRVGRVPLPIGIYNEIKDVGTLLPFYRPSGSFYGDGTWTSDSVDGIVLTYESAATGDWSFDGHLYYGEWERIEFANATLDYTTADIKNAIGAWLWINTPVEGLRIGLGANHLEVQDTILRRGEDITEETLYASVDAAFDPWTVRIEYSQRSWAGGRFTPWYAEVDVRLTDRLHAAARYENADLRFEIPFLTVFEESLEEVKTIGLRYDVLPNLTAKLEHQWFEGYSQVESIPLSIILDDPVETELSIVSLAWSF